MNRIKRLSAGILAAVVYLGSLPVLPVAAVAVVVPLTGCSAALDFANAFIASAKAIVAADPNAPYVADLNLAITAMQTAETGWNGSSVNCDQIVPGSPVALIATVAVAGFDALAAILFPCTTPPALASAAISEPHSSLRATSRAYSGYRARIQGAVFKEHAYRQAFNGAAKDSGLTVRI
jgi:hypothetical protein